MVIPIGAILCSGDSCLHCSWFGRTSEQGFCSTLLREVTPNANLRILISDEAAIKASLCNKGASGLVFCMACQNAICFEEQFRSPDQQFGNGQPEVPAEDSSSHPRHHGFLASQQGLRPKAEFEKLQTALGFDFKPEGLLVTDCVMFDWCSTYTC